MRLNAAVVVLVVHAVLVQPKLVTSKLKLPSLETLLKLNSGKASNGHKPTIGDGTIMAEVRNRVFGTHLTADDVVAQRQQIVVSIQEKLKAFQDFVKEYRTWGRPGELVYHNGSAEFEERKEIFFNTIDMIVEHNTQFSGLNSSFVMGVNQFSDFDASDALAMVGLVPEEEEHEHEHVSEVKTGHASEIKTGLRRLTTKHCVFAHGKLKCHNERDDDDADDDNPGAPPKNKDMQKWATDLDWSTNANPTNRSLMTKVFNQGWCNNCWAVSAITTLEAHYALKFGMPPPIISIAHPTDCMARDCNPNSVLEAYGFAKRHGVTSERIYESSDDAQFGSVGKCTEQRDSSLPSLFRVKKFSVTRLYKIRANTGLDPGLVLERLVQRGPVAISMRAFSTAKNSLLAYKGGIYDAYFSCVDRHAPNRIDHATMVVGYGVENGTAYWKIRNSWGPGWGEGGYFRLSRGKAGTREWDQTGRGMCNVLSSAYHIDDVEAWPGASPELLAKASLPLSPCEQDLAHKDPNATCALPLLHRIGDELHSDVPVHIGERLHARMEHAVEGVKEDSDSEESAEAELSLKLRAAAAHVHVHGAAGSDGDGDGDGAAGTAGVNDRVRLRPSVQQKIRMGLMAGLSKVAAGANETDAHEARKAREAGTSGARARALAAADAGTGTGGTGIGTGTVDTADTAAAASSTEEEASGEAEGVCASRLAQCDSVGRFGHCLCPLAAQSCASRDPLTNFETYYCEYPSRLQRLPAPHRPTSSVDDLVGGKISLADILSGKVHLAMPKNAGADLSKLFHGGKASSDGDGDGNQDALVDTKNAASLLLKGGHLLNADGALAATATASARAGSSIARTKRQGRGAPGGVLALAVIGAVLAVSASLVGAVLFCRRRRSSWNTVAEEAPMQDL